MKNRNIPTKSGASGATKLTTRDAQLLKSYFSSKDKLGVELAEHMLTCIELVESVELFLSDPSKFDAALKAHLQSRKSFKKALTYSLAAQIQWNEVLKEITPKT